MSWSLSLTLCPHVPKKCHAVRGGKGEGIESRQKEGYTDEEERSEKNVLGQSPLLSASHLHS